MSNTATIGTFGMISLQELIPIRFAGLWSGARSLHSSIAFITSSLMTTEDANFSPPCTTRCPTALISSSDLTMPWSGLVSASITSFTATVWFGIGVSILTLSFPAGVCMSTLPSMPMRSQSPFASTASVALSMSWYLSEELPQLITKMFIVLSLHIK